MYCKPSQITPLSSLKASHRIVSNPRVIVADTSLRQIGLELVAFAILKKLESNLGQEHDNFEKILQLELIMRRVWARIGVIDLVIRLGLEFKIKTKSRVQLVLTRVRNNAF